MIERLEVSIKRGHIKIRTDPKLQEPLIQSSVILTETQYDNTLRLESTFRQSLDLEIALPASVQDVAINCGLGNTELYSLIIQNAEINVGNGNFHADHIEGHWDINLGHGDLTLRHGRGYFDLNAGLGAIRLHQLEQVTADVNAGLGPVLLEQCQGTFDINAGKGDVNIEALQGQVEVNAGLGKILMLASHDVECKCHAGLGSITLKDGTYRQAELVTGIGKIDVHARTTSLTAKVESRGDINVEIPTDLACRIEASTDLGRIISHLDLVEVNNPGPARGHRLVGRIGTGSGGVITLHTRKGDISLSQYPAPVETADEPTNPAADPRDPRAVILEKLQQGIITVEEAAALLDQLEGDQNQAT
ncbi:DUF4097 family beta strand repeat-containing protein [Sulfobacillus thermosulfidooxidans]|uniref:DUF4097 family beta strand repeat-containing protein n=1 Tax=Sulfobacillus thermosulfidooxidans TaxID=28034 RepID=UPI0006B68873|nr:DUF4097 family beta strand repeat-containing protein [Sulfobacillus thermosulfidooxidans]